MAATVVTLKTKKPTSAERRRAKKEEAERRQYAILDALENRLTDDALEVLTTALCDIASDYGYAVNHAIEEAEREMLDGLEEVAETWGWALVDAAGEEAIIEVDIPVATCVSDASKYAHTYDASYDPEQEFAALHTHVEAANLRHPAKEEDK